MPTGGTEDLPSFLLSSLSQTDIASILSSLLSSPDSVCFSEPTTLTDLGRKLDIGGYVDSPSDFVHDARRVLGGFSSPSAKEAGDSLKSSLERLVWEKAFHAVSPSPGSGGARSLLWKEEGREASRMEAGARSEAEDAAGEESAALRGEEAECEAVDGRGNEAAQYLPPFRAIRSVAALVRGGWSAPKGETLSDALFSLANGDASSFPDVPNENWREALTHMGADPPPHSSKEELVRLFLFVSDAASSALETALASSPVPPPTSPVSRTDEARHGEQEMEERGKTDKSKEEKDKKSDGHRDKEKLVTAETVKKILDTITQSPNAYFFKKLRASDHSLAVKCPMDLDTVWDRFKKKKYTNVSQVKKDVDLIWENCLDYHEEGGFRSESARSLRSTTKKEFSSLPEVATIIFPPRPLSCYPRPFPISVPTSSPPFLPFHRGCKGDEILKRVELYYTMCGKEGGEPFAAYLLKRAGYDRNAPYRMSDSADIRPGTSTIAMVDAVRVALPHLEISKFPFNTTNEEIGRWWKDFRTRMESVCKTGIRISSSPFGSDPLLGERKERRGREERGRSRSRSQSRKRNRSRSRSPRRGGEKRKRSP